MDLPDTFLHVANL